MGVFSRRFDPPPWWTAQAFGFVAALGACVAPAVGEPAALAVELGAGRTQFEPFDEESPSLEVVSGPQGGWHFELTLRLDGYDGRPLALDYRARDDAGDSVGFPATYLVSSEKFVATGDGQHVRVGDRVVLEIDGPRAVAGNELVVSCEASHDGAVLASDEQRVSVVDEVNELD
jgi:hypothetical protein